MKIIDKIVVSPTPPTQIQNAAWFDGKEIKIPSKGKFESTGGSGGGIEIVDSVDKLDPNAELGSMASVVTAGSIQETSFRNLYQPDASMLDQSTGTLTAPELLSSVLSVSVFAPEDITRVGFEPVGSGLYLVPRDFSMTSTNMAIIQIAQQGVMAMTTIGSYDTMQQFVLAEYSQDTMSYTIHNDQVEAFNAVLANGMDWCYFGNPDGGITEEQFATIDLFIKIGSDIPSKAHVYLKKDNWEELYAKDFEKLASDISSKADIIIMEELGYDKVLKPNTYYKYETAQNVINISLTLTLANNDGLKYNEYILELKCLTNLNGVSFTDENGTPLTIKWANGLPPSLVDGNTYLISIANGFGVYSMFTNS